MAAKIAMEKISQGGIRYQLLSSEVEDEYLSATVAFE